MALMLGALRDALIDAGAKPDKADRAAEELAGYENRLASVDTRLAVLTWMVGINVTLSLLLIGAAFSMWSRLGDISGALAQIARTAH